MQPKLLVPEAPSKESVSRTIKISTASTSPPTYFAEVPGRCGPKRIYIRPLDILDSDILRICITERDVLSNPSSENSVVKISDTNTFFECTKRRKGQSKEDAIEERVNKLYAPRFNLFGIIRF